MDPHCQSEQSTQIKVLETLTQKDIHRKHKYPLTHKPQTRPKYPCCCPRDHQGASITAWEWPANPGSQFLLPLQTLPAEGRATGHSPVLWLFRRNSICSVCPACSARARGVGAAGSPEKQLTPAPQPRSAWVSARSVVVTAAHRA